MEKYAILLSYIDKQWMLIDKLHKQLMTIDCRVYELRYVFALKMQQFYTAFEDLLKQIAKSFENHIQDLSSSHKQLLMRLHMEIPKIRPRVIAEESFLLLDKIRAFRHFIRHAYDCELLETELQEIQNYLKVGYKSLERDLSSFRSFVEGLA